MSFLKLLIEISKKYASSILLDASPPIPLVKRLLKPHILVSVAHFFEYTLLVDLIFEAMVIVYLIIK